MTTNMNTYIFKSVIFIPDKFYPLVYLSFPGGKMVNLFWTMLFVQPDSTNVIWVTNMLHLYKYHEWVYRWRI